MIAVDLSGANLRDANLDEARLICTNLTAANLEGAIYLWCVKALYESVTLIDSNSADRTLPQFIGASKFVK